MKMIFSNKQAVEAIGVSIIALLIVQNILANELSVTKMGLQEFELGGTLRHIEYLDDDKLILLSTREGILYDLNQNEILEKYHYQLCGSPVPVFTSNDAFNIFCTGRGFTDIQLKSCQGVLLWRYSREQGFPLSAAHAMDDSGNPMFYVGTHSGLYRIDRHGQTQFVSDDIVASILVPSGSPLYHAITLSRRYSFLRDRSMVEYRNNNMDIVAQINVARKAMQVVGASWPDDESVLYRSQNILYGIRSNGQEIGKVKIGNRVIHAKGTPIQVDDTELMAVLLLYSTTVAQESRLMIISPEFECLYSESMPSSHAMTVVKNEGKEFLLVGCSDGKVSQYQITWR